MYSHASLFSPVLSTLEAALQRNFLINMPGLTCANLKRYPPHTVATAKGHLKQTRKGVQSTKSKDPTPLPLLDHDSFPEPLTNGQRTHNIYAAVIDRSPTGQIFTDQTGRFVIPSSTGNNYMLVLYDYDSNYIDAVPMPNRTAKSILTAFTTSYNKLIRAGLRPQLQRLDNECSDILKDFLLDHGIQHQLAPPGIHRRNAAERAIQTFKDHFIAGLSSTDPQFPLHLWDKLIPQALLSLNLLRASRVNPQLSAHAQIHGQFDFNATPIAPPGTHVVIHDKPDKRLSFGPRGDDGWYVGPALDHYRCYKVYNWKTKAIQTADTLAWFPAKVSMPIATQTDVIEAAILDIKTALLQPPAPLAGPISPTHLSATTLNDLNTIFAQPGKPSPAPLLRVAAPPADPTFHSYPWTRSQRRKRTTIRAKESNKQQAVVPATKTAHAAIQSTNTNLLHWFLTTFEADPQQHQAHKAINPDTGQLAELPELLKCSTKAKWDRANSLEWGRLANGCHPELPKGTNAIRFIRYTDIPPPRRKDVTYVRQVTADRPHKTEQERVRATAGGDRINYPFEVSTKTADLTTAKLLINSTISTPGARFMSADLKDFYLSTKEMKRPEYARVSLKQIPKAIIDQYDITSIQTNGFVYIEITGGMYGLPQAGRLANDELLPRLAAAGYHQSQRTPGLFLHTTRPIRFCLVVDDFGISYTGKEHADHLLATLKHDYQVTCDWKGEQFCGITLQWDYENGTVDLSMPGYVERALQRFQHTCAKPSDAPHKHNVPHYGAKVQMTTPDDTPLLSDPKQTSHIREVVGVLLYYARAIDNTMQVALGSIAACQAHATEMTMQECVDLLNYAATHPDAVIRYTSSDMCLWIHGDASYLSETEARSRAGAFFFLSNHPDKVPQHSMPTINGPVHILSTIMRNVMASAAEAEVGASYLAAQEACPIRTTLEELGHRQPPTPLQTDNSIAKGIIEGTVKQKRSKAIDMRFYWIKDRVQQGQFAIYWRPGATNMGDYFTKHHSPAHHLAMRPLYLYTEASSTAREQYEQHCKVENERAAARNTGTSNTSTAT